MILPSLIQFLGTHPGATVADLRRAGWRLGPARGGHFRRIFPIPDAGAVLKIPRPYQPQPGDEPWRDPIQHALVEIDTVERIRRDDRLRHLRRYTAEIYFADRATGLILMKAYHKARAPRRHRHEELLLVEIFRESLGKWTADYGLRNLMRDEEERPIVVDLGY